MMNIYMTIAGKRQYKITTCKNMEEGKRKIELFEAEDRYEHEVEKYPMPRGWEGQYPTYHIVK